METAWSNALCSNNLAIGHDVLDWALAYTLALRFPTAERLTLALKALPRIAPLLTATLREPVGPKLPAIDEDGREEPGVWELTSILSLEAMVDGGGGFGRSGST